MMTFFPTPYKDELLYSVLARYNIRSPNLDTKETMLDIYGKSGVVATVDLPSSINSIIENMPITHEYDSDFLIKKHTLYSFYSSFVSEEIVGQIKDYMLGDKGNSIYNKIGLMASGISFNHYLRFCPGCVKEDVERYGEAYWHRIHQIPCIYICPNHNELIYDSQVVARGHNRYEYIAASMEVCKTRDRNIKYNDDIFEKLLKLSKDSYLLLNMNTPNKSLEWFTEQYKEKLKERGLASANGRVSQRDFIEEFTNFYGKDFLKLVQSEVDIESGCNWLSNIVRRKDKSTHAIRHLLLIRFLNISIDDVFNKSLKQIQSIDLSENNKDKLKKESDFKYSVQRFERIASCRQQWIQLQDENPNMSRSKLRIENPRVYMYLYSNDNDWLMNNSPERLVTANFGTRINWEERDGKILKQVETVISKISQIEGKPIRISMTRIGSELGIRILLEQHLEKLPKTKEYLNQNIDTLKSYQLKRIEWIIKELDKQGKELLASRIYRKACIRKKHISGLESHVNELIKKYE